MNPPPIPPPPSPITSPPLRAIRHPILGLLSLGGVIPAWAIFFVSVIVVGYIHKATYWRQGTQGEIQAAGFAIFGIIGAMLLGIVSGILGLAATIQTTRSRVTGIIGLVASGLLLLAGLSWYVTFFNK